VGQDNGAELAGDDAVLEVDGDVAVPCHSADTISSL